MFGKPSNRIKAITNQEEVGLILRLIERNKTNKKITEKERKENDRIHNLRFNHLKSSVL